MNRFDDVVRTQRRHARELRDEAIEEQECVGRETSRAECGCPSCVDEMRDLADHRREVEAGQ